eukprot:5390793-Prymnesium_polylepis.1
MSGRTHRRQPVRSTFMRTVNDQVGRLPSDHVRLRARTGYNSLTCGEGRSAILILKCAGCGRPPPRGRGVCSPAHGNASQQMTQPPY